METLMRSWEQDKARLTSQVKMRQFLRKQTEVESLDLPVSSQDFLGLRRKVRREKQEALRRKKITEFLWVAFHSQ
jgi:hypothetical protein